MIESLKKTRADLHRACYRHDAEEMTRLSGKLCAMLAQEIMMAFGGVSIADSVVILAACKLTAIFVKDAGKKVRAFRRNFGSRGGRTCGVCEQKHHENTGREARPQGGRQR